MVKINVILLKKASITIVFFFMLMFIFSCQKVTFEDCWYHQIVRNQQQFSKDIYLGEFFHYALLYKKDTLLHGLWDDVYKGYDFMGVGNLDYVVNDPICRGYFSAERIPFIQCIWQDTLDNNSAYQHKIAMANEQRSKAINSLLKKYGFQRLPNTKAEWAALLHLVKILQIPPYIEGDSVLIKISSMDTEWEQVKKVYKLVPDSLKNPYKTFDYCCYKKNYEIVHTPLPKNSVYICFMPKFLLKERKFSFNNYIFFRVDFYISQDGYLQTRKTLLNPASLDRNSLWFR